jgi:hypothetical protein
LSRQKQSIELYNIFALVPGICEAIIQSIKQSRDRISPQNARDENAESNDTNNQSRDHLGKDAILSHADLCDHEEWQIWKP